MFLYIYTLYFILSAIFLFTYFSIKILGVKENIISIKFFFPDHQRRSFISTYQLINYITYYKQEKQKHHQTFCIQEVSWISLILYKYIKEIKNINKQNFFSIATHKQGIRAKLYIRLNTCVLLLALPILRTIREKKKERKITFLLK